MKQINNLSLEDFAMIQILFDGGDKIIDKYAKALDKILTANNITLSEFSIEAVKASVKLLVER